MSFQFNDMASCAGFGLSLPSVQVAASDTTVCSGQPVHFIAAPTQGGSRPHYQWLVNGKKVGADSSGFTYMPANGDTVQCAMLSSDFCAFRVDASSPPIVMQVLPVLTPAISIAADDTGMRCPGSLVRFAATATGAGSSPAFQWYKNGSPVTGATGGSYGTTTAANLDSFFCVVRSSAACRSMDSASSNTVKLLIGNPTPTVSLRASPGGAPCAGTLRTLSAHPGYGGASPAYTWLRNGSPIPGAGNGPVLTSASLVNNDQVTVLLRSGISCAEPQQVSAAPLTLHFSPLLVPEAIITAEPGTTVCQGQKLTLKAHVINGGGNPAYKWLLNGEPLAGQTGSDYITSSLQSSDRVQLQLHSSAECTMPDTALSNELLMEVLPIITPTVTVTAKPAGRTVAGVPLAFEARSTGAGRNPGFQWTLNGSDIPGAIDSIYTTDSLRGYYRISVRLRSSEPCANPGTVTSDAIIGQAEDAFAIYPSPFAVQLPFPMSGETYLLRVEAEGGSRYAGKVVVLW